MPVCRTSSVWRKIEDTIAALQRDANAASVLFTLKAAMENRLSGLERIQEETVRLRRSLEAELQVAAMGERLALPSRSGIESNIPTAAAANGAWGIEPLQTDQIPSREAGGETVWAVEPTRAARSPNRPRHTTPLGYSTGLGTAQH